MGYFMCNYLANMCLMTYEYFYLKISNRFKDFIYLIVVNF